MPSGRSFVLQRWQGLLTQDSAATIGAVAMDIVAIMTMFVIARLVTKALTVQSVRKLLHTLD